MHTLTSILQTHLGERPDAPFLVFEAADGRVLTRSYREQFDQAAAVATTLRANGIEPGHYVVAALGNSVEFFDLWFGTALAGAVFVPTNPLNSADDLAWILADTGARVAVGD